MAESVLTPGHVRHDEGVPAQSRRGEPPLAVLTLHVPSRWAVIEAGGELDTQCVSRLRSLFAAAGDHVVVDLRGVTFMDASGLGVLATGGHRAGRLGGAVRLVGPSRQVRRLLALTRLDQVLTVFDTMAEALTDDTRGGLHTVS